MTAVDDKSYSFLVAEDNIMMLKMMLSALKTLGYRNLLAAGDGQEAWDILQIEKVDIILSDFIMPRLNGLEFLNKVRRSDLYWSLPFVMITSEARKSRVIYTTEDEVDGYIVKPITVEKLGQYIKSTLRNRYNPGPYHKALFRGKLNLRRGNKEKALEAFQEAVQHDPKKSSPYYYLGELQEGASQDDEALTCYTKCDDVSSSLYVRAFDGQARIYFKKKDYASAAQVLKRAVDVSPANVNRSLLLGDCCFKTGDLESLRKTLLDAAEIAGDNETVVEKIAKACYDYQLYTEAENVLHKIYDESVRGYKVFNQFGLMAKANGEYEKAKTYYNEALRIRPQSDVVNYNCAVLHIETKEYQTAKSYLKRALLHHADFQAGKELLEKLENFIAKEEGASADQTGQIAQ